MVKCALALQHTALSLWMELVSCKVTRHFLSGTICLLVCLKPKITYVWPNKWLTSAVVSTTGSIQHTLVTFESSLALILLFVQFLENKK